MNWIKKLFRVFKEEDSDLEESIDRKEPIHITMNKQRIENGKKVNAKVVYQYPKGQFRFPLVPDHEDNRRPPSAASDKKPIRRKEGRTIPSTPSRPRQQARKVQQTVEKKPVDLKPRERKSEFKTSGNKQESKANQQTPRLENRAIGPFKPTKIPSPVYGFKERPNIKELDHKEVEIELESVDAYYKTREEPTNTSREQEIDASFKSVETFSVEEDVVINNGKEELQKPDITLETAVTPEEEPILQDEPIHTQRVQVIDEVSEPVKVVSEAEDVINDGKEELQKPDITLETAVTLEEESILQDEPIHAQRVQVIDEVSEPVKVIPEAEDVINDEKEELQEPDITLVETAVTLEEEPGVSTIQADSINENLNPLNIEHGTENTDIKLEAEPVSDPDEPKEKSSIPFNVIMLKQDKHKLMKEKSKRVFQKENGITTSNEQKVQSAEVVHLEDVSVKAFREEPQEKQEQEKLQDRLKQELKEPTDCEQDKSYATVNTERPNSEPLEDIHYSFPSMELLNPPVMIEGNDDWITEQTELLDSTLKNFNVGAKVVNVTQGPAVTRFEVQPEPGVKVNKITNLSDDIKLSLAAKDIRIEAPIPGKHTIGIEVPNQKSRAVYIREIIDDPEFYEQKSPLTAVLGLDISGKPIVTDLRKMPHGLIAGATGSGKSVCINTILVSLLYKANPNQLKLLLIDPKMVELAPYNHIPHLVSPVITDVKAATAALKWAVEEMERRYELFAHSGVRDINRFNEMAQEHKQYADQLPYIVIVIDELADLMMMSPADVEEAISRIAQKARACGIHLIIATQRPSVDVITGLIKANIPTRIAFSVSSQIDSRTIIDISGAEKLLGKGDMLFLENGSSKPVRIQGTYVSDSEIDKVVSYVREQGDPDYLFQQEELLKKSQVEEEDELFFEACEFVVENGGASTSLLQRRFKIGYNRAARLIDMMEYHGYISESKGSKPRDVYLTDADLETLHS